MRPFVLGMGLLLVAGSLPASAEGNAAELVLADVFCKLRGDQEAIEYLLTRPLLETIRVAQAKNDKIQEAAPDEKPPLGDGVPYQSYQDAAPQCSAGNGSVDGKTIRIEIKYTFPKTPDANWIDRLVLEWEGPLLRIDDVEYGPDFAIGLRKSLGEMFPE